MAIEFDEKPKKGKTPGTRMYATAQTQKQTGKGGARAKSGRGKPASANDVVTDEEGYRIHLTEDEDNPLARIGMMFSAFLLAGMILFMLFGYEQISRAYADINTLNSEIELTQLRITALNVEIECAVTIQQAQEAAEAAGMRYPVQSQYIKIGSQIPISGAAPQATTGAAAPAAATTPAPDAGTPAPQDQGPVENTGGAQPEGTD